MIVPRKPGRIVATHPDGREGVVVHRQNTSSDWVYVYVLSPLRVTASCNWRRRDCAFRFVPL